MKSLITVLLSITLVGCSNNTNNQEENPLSDTIKNDTTVLKGFTPLRETVLYYDSISEDDPFIDFFKLFNEDSLFQLNHTKKPYECIVMEMEGGWDTTNIDQKSYCNLLEQQGEYDTYELYVSKKQNYYIVKMRGLDNGIHSEYWFKHEGESFILEKIEDSSN